MKPRQWLGASILFAIFTLSMKVLLPAFSWPAYFIVLGATALIVAVIHFAIWLITE